MSTPGVIHKSRFVISTSEEFKNYIDYVDRDEAIRNNAYSRYSAYNDYMGNPEKTSALFTQDRNFLRDKDKEKVKDLFSMAQSKKSIMWQDVFSFNNAWLEKVGFYDRRTKDIDEEKIKNAVRASMKYWFEEDGLDGSAIWSAAIHYNTDNIHIHIATCELNPLKQRGKRTLKTLENMKSKFVNNLCNEKESYKKINDIIRENIVSDINSINYNKNKLKNLYKKVVENLPSDRRQWHYNYNTMSDARVYLDKITSLYIDEKKSNDWSLLMKELDKQEHILKEVYGKGKNEKYKHYKDNKIQDLYTRCGNRILNEIKEHIRMEELREKELLKIKDKKLREKRNKKINLKIFASNLKKLEKSLNDEFNSLKNQSYYDRLQEEKEYNM